MTIDMIERLLQNDMAWRKKEISDLYLLAKDKRNEVIYKSLILLLYAHWEGYIKRSSKLYLKFISEKKIKISELTLNFKAISLKGHVKNCITTKDSLTLSNELTLINKYAKNLDNKFKISIDPDNDIGKDIIDTNNNLNPKVFKNIVSIMGLEYRSALQTREHYINSNLLANRNAIGHGSPFDVASQIQFSLSFEDIDKLKNIIISIMDYFTDEILYYIEHELYLIKNLNQKNNYDLVSERKLEEIFKNIEKV